MSQFSHDEFDEVQPYRRDEVGKHRAAGAPAAAAGSAASSGMLKWIGLAVVAVLLIAAAGWFITRDADDDAPVAEEQDTADEGEAAETDDEAEGDGNGDEGADEGEADENGEAEEDAPASGLSDDHPVRAVNAGAPDGSASQLSSELNDLGLDVQQSIDWDFANWGTPNTPQVMYPSEEQQELAEAIAEELDIDIVSQDGSWQTIVVIVGPDYQ
ncbi:LytR C-terminal domain-containing protein [Nesterenkonia sphaerica]|uniref:LytR/CpsA/Psr regulator C-terminal domain-containing protein n=1 Tax=Nesterenkonia sphaerica TaxID=1804988 RepID=A0A5R9A7R9_9MICC|nr:LytR C-terminal domain-containing protein [Nesterenkonia sphaerica]TLP74055.1 hypothetical protein FEF27_09895 [Nesterenkonia sphaerica]